MHTIYKTALALGFSVICAAGLTAQTQETKTTTTKKIEIKDGKDVTSVGCLERNASGDYILAETRDLLSTAPAVRYSLVTSDDLSKRVGQRVEVRGKAVERDSGKVSIESKTKTEVENGKDQETKTKTVGTAGAFGMPMLGVTSMKTISSSCL